MAVERNMMRFGTVEFDPLEVVHRDWDFEWQTDSDGSRSRRSRLRGARVSLENGVLLILDEETARDYKQWLNQQP